MTISGMAVTSNAFSHRPAFYGDVIFTSGSGMIEYATAAVGILIIYGSVPKIIDITISDLLRCASTLFTDNSIFLASYVSGSRLTRNNLNFCSFLAWPKM
jgi:hypothetical protein